MARKKFDSNLSDRQENRQTYYEEKAEKLKREADAAFSRGTSMASCIPMGQPILIGHHSEKRDRRFRARIDETFRRGCKLLDKAKYYANRNVDNDSIKSLDEKADEKLQNKIDQLIKNVDLMKQANKIIRKVKSNEDYENIMSSNDISEEMKKLLKKNREITQGIYKREENFRLYSFELTNTNAEIRRLKKRLETLKHQDAREDFYFKNDTVEIKEEDSRFNLYFDGKPSDEIRNKLKSLSFKWSPSRTAWTRQITTSTPSEHIFRQLKQFFENLGV